MNPTKGNRHALFLCGIPVSPEAPTDQVIAFSREFLRTQIPGTDVIPVLRTTSSANHTYHLKNTQDTYSLLRDTLLKQLSVPNNSQYAKLVSLLCQRVQTLPSQLHL